LILEELLFWINKYIQDTLLKAKSAKQKAKSAKRKATMTMTKAKSEKRQ